MLAHRNRVANFYNPGAVSNTIPGNAADFYQIFDYIERIVNDARRGDGMTGAAGTVRAQMVRLENIIDNEGDIGIQERMAEQYEELVDLIEDTW